MRLQSEPFWGLQRKLVVFPVWWNVIVHQLRVEVYRHDSEGLTLPNSVHLSPTQLSTHERWKTILFEVRYMAEKDPPQKGSCSYHTKSLGVLGQLRVVNYFFSSPYISTAIALPSCLSSACRRIASFVALYFSFMCVVHKIESVFSHWCRTMVNVTGCVCSSCCSFCFMLIPNWYRNLRKLTSWYRTMCISDLVPYVKLFTQWRCVLPIEHS